MFQLPCCREHHCHWIPNLCNYLLKFPCAHGPLHFAQCCTAFRYRLSQVKHLDQAEAHNHLATREIAAFLRNVLDIQRDSEAMVYITAVGGVPFADYIQGLPTQFMEIH